jgi:hypothetical protein
MAPIHVSGARDLPSPFSHETFTVNFLRPLFVAQPRSYRLSTSGSGLLLTFTLLPGLDMSLTCGHGCNRRGLSPTRRILLSVLIAEEKGRHQEMPSAQDIVYAARELRGVRRYRNWMFNIPHSYAQEGMRLAQEDTPGTAHEEIRDEIRRTNRRSEGQSS